MPESKRRKLTEMEKLKLLGERNTMPAITKRKLTELVNQIDPNERLDPDVESVLLDISDDFLENLVTFAAKLAKHRGSDSIEVKDLMIPLGMLFLFLKISAPLFLHLLSFLKSETIYPSQGKTNAALLTVRAMLILTFQTRGLATKSLRRRKTIQHPYTRLLRGSIAAGSKASTAVGSTQGQRRGCQTGH